MAPSVCSPLRGEIVSHEPVQASLLAEIAQACARDLGCPLEIATVHPAGSDRSGAKSGPQDATITLSLPAEWAASQHAVWCLACRLACFCPSARVSVLVTGAFTQQDGAHAHCDPLSA